MAAYAFSSKRIYLIVIGYLIHLSSTSTQAFTFPPILIPTTSALQPPSWSIRKEADAGGSNGEVLVSGIRRSIRKDLTFAQTLPLKTYFVDTSKHLDSTLTSALILGFGSDVVQIGKLGENIKDPDFQVTGAGLFLDIGTSIKNFTCNDRDINLGSSRYTGWNRNEIPNPFSLVSIRAQLMGPAWSRVFEHSESINCLCPSTYSQDLLEDFLPLMDTTMELSRHCKASNLISVDIKPIIDSWLEGNVDFYERSLDTLVFSIVIDGPLMNFFVLNSANLQVHVEYFLDRRCFISGSEGCPSGKCKGVEKICKFRPFCPENECGRSCDFEQKCDWTWAEKKGKGTTGFVVTTGAEVMKNLQPHETSGPLKDPQNDTNGHFLLLEFSEVGNASTVYHITSPWYQHTEDTCYLEARIHMYNMQDGSIKMLLTTQNHTVWEPMNILGNQKNMWEKITQRIGRTRLPTQVILEITPSSKIPAHVAIDNIRLVQCFHDGPPVGQNCSRHEFRCSNNMCIHRNKVCDFYKDCPFGEDEKQNCDRMPVNTTCTFESGWCGWQNLSESSVEWEIRNLPSASELTGPSYDHTFQNSSGHFLYVYMNKNNSQFNDKATLQSQIFAPPPSYHSNSTSPYYKSCEIRFSYHMFGPHMGGLQLDAHEINPRVRRRFKPVWQIYGDQGNMWHSVSQPLPDLNYLYYLSFTAQRGRRYIGDIALDDISLSPECVGLRVPSSELRGYHYEAVLQKLHEDRKNDVPQVVPSNITKYEFTTCNKTGRFGPTQQQCIDAYKETLLNNSVKVITDATGQSTTGIQVWAVPQTRHYTLIAKGASGGRGAESNQMTSHGSIVKVTLLLRQGEKLYILVGQEGASVCDQNVTLPDKIRDACGSVGTNTSSLGRVIRAPKNRNAFVDLFQMNKILGGGGGGGGGTFIWKMDGKTQIPLLVAGGGGGLAYNASSAILPYGRGFNMSLEPQSGSTQPNGAGGGGGWRGPKVRFNLEGMEVVSSRLGTLKERFKEDDDGNTTMWIAAGESVIDGGGLGGVPCIDSIKWGANGGFGGGGGGCTAGGAGGGYVGGNAHTGLSANGEGGLSYIVKGGLYTTLEPGGHEGPGAVVIIPSLANACGCKYQCVILDDFHSRFRCVCGENAVLTEDGASCMEREVAFPVPYLIGLIILCLVVFAIVGLLCICLYNRYQRQKVALLRRKMLGGPELQLSRLRAQAGPNGVLTEYNPNYEFGGETYNLTDLKEIPRENLQLVKALGQGAFGEVYQGFYKQRAGDSVEMPVAVKTLPELSSNQAEMDFLMEALIMSKFNHANIVHFIGVCFDKHPRFIILELLAGGDLKTFLRESRPKPERSSPLTMKDLLTCAKDVANGCRYLEENHFIHRDIAARNCLLTTKGPGRVVKIADFGMARDIYRADYYKKGGKAMLPVKWMPPEAFLDGIFTSKTDVWSFGVLLWEVFSLGYMPYPGRGNQDVMQLVTNGGRLEPPTNCPAPVYGIMTQCWHPIPEERPNFATLQERVGYCLQDPEVVNAPLPVFQRPPSSERDATLMRPNPTDESSCLRIVHGHRSSNATMSTEPTSPNSSTADYLVPLTPYSFGSTTTPGADTMSTVTLPDSQSAQTLLDEDDQGERKEKRSESTTESAYPSTKAPDRKSQSPQNGIETGLTLTPATLKDKTRRPGPYVNVGMQNLDRSDEEIRC